MNYLNCKLKNIHTLHACILYTEGDIKLPKTQCRWKGKTRIQNYLGKMKMVEGKIESNYTFQSNQLHTKVIPQTGKTFSGMIYWLLGNTG